jgi:hypothetical protein
MYIGSHEHISMSTGSSSGHKFRKCLAHPEASDRISPSQVTGGVVEWLMAPVLKTGRAKALVGSNPTPSAILISDFGLRIAEWAQDSGGDETSGQHADQHSANDVGEVVSCDVHSRECD